MAHCWRTGDITEDQGITNQYTRQKLSEVRLSRKKELEIIPANWILVFQSVYRHELETRLSHNPWEQETAKIPDWPRRKAVAEFRLCVEHDCLGTRLHRIAIRPDPYCTLCSLREPMDRNHLGQCTALFTGTGCERYWEAKTKNDGKLTLFLFYYYFCDYSLLLGLSYLTWMLFIVLTVFIV